MPDYTTTGLIANCKRRGFIPEGSGLDTSDFLQILTEQLRNYIPAFLKGLREEFLIAQLSLTVNSATIPVPVRACGIALRTIEWTCGDGTLRPIPRIEPERRGDFGLTGSEPQGYYFQGNNLILLPAVTSGTVVVSYQQRPGQLVRATDCATVTGQDDAYSFNVNAIPSTFAVGSVVDIVAATPNFKMLALGRTVTICAGNIIGFAEVLPSDYAVGDYVCLAGETPVPQLPLECFDLLAQAAAVEIAQATGSTRLQAVKDGLKDLREQVALILSPRNDGSARVIINRSGIGRRWL